MNTQPYKIAILAMGGEGGGVLADWIVQLGESNGFVAQTTSVPGVAQRTGATIYYVELFDQRQSTNPKHLPVLSLMPMPGDVDIVLASELMEAGRAVVRGLVTPKRTTLIASTHRVYAMSEKSHMGDGRVDASQLLNESSKMAKRFIGFDMEKVAQESQSVISAVLFGSLAASKTLPFTKEQFEETIRRGGVGVIQSIKAFTQSYTLSLEPTRQVSSKEAVAKVETFNLPSLTGLHPKIKRLIERIDHTFPAQSHEILLHGVRRLVDYQDPEYAQVYLDRLDGIEKFITPQDSHLIAEVARHLALWMTYEDTARVAGLKIQASRFERVRQEAKVQNDQLVLINEYMHPRVQEIAETLPSLLGRMIVSSKILSSILGAFTSKGRVIQTSSVRGFLMLSLVACAKHWRRTTLRYKSENAMIENWLDLVVTFAKMDSTKTLEWVKCQVLVKGYGDTHARGVKNFNLIHALVKNNLKISAVQIQELRAAALADEQGTSLNAVLSKYHDMNCEASEQTM